MILINAADTNITDINERLIKLMNIASKGNREAFEEIVEIMSPKLRKVIKFYQKKDYDDVLQEIWLKVWEKVSALYGKENPESWFYTVARYHCIGDIRKEHSQKRLYESIALENIDYSYNTILAAAAEYEDMENLLIKKETANFIRKHIHSLPELYSLPIHLYYFDDMPLKEISSLLNISVSTVKWRLYIGRQALKKAFFKFKEDLY